MKKSLLALAVLGAFAGVASAQTNVTLYGLADVGFQSNDNGGPNGRKNGIESGGQSASRVGFKGTEDLGNGLKALFVLESGFNTDDGSGFNGFNRFSYVGLGGDFGTVTLGRQNTPLKDAYAQIDPFGAAGMGNMESIFFGGTKGFVPAAGGVPAQDFGGVGNNGRIANTVKYATPNFSGFNGGVSYTFGEVRGTNSAGREYGLNLGYANGPLNIQFGYADENDTSRVTANDVRKAFLGGTYDFGAAKLHAAYAESKQDQAGAADNKFRNGLIGVSVPFGASAVMATYAINQDRTAGISDADTKRLALMYTYDMSKRTNLYAGYAYTKNDRNAVIGLDSVARAGDDPKLFAVGIRHKF